MKRQPLNWIFWIVLFVFLVRTINCGRGKPSSDQKMNVLLITLDTLRADHLGCYGYAKNTSPTLDALASTSIVFDHAIAQSAITPVSHASIMTGLNPYNHDLRSLHGGVSYQLPDSRLTLAELMEANGYATGGFVSAFPVTKHYGLHQGFETWDEEFQKKDQVKILSETGVVNTGTAQRTCDVTTEKAIVWLRQHAEMPFFAWIHYFDVHDPILLPPDEYLKRFYPKSRDKPDILRSVYDAEIAFMDDQINLILKELEALKIRENTILAVLSDHGEGLGDHDWWGHSILYQEQIRLVFILSLPGRREGVRVSSLVRSIDLVPTLHELLNLNTTGKNVFDGKSLLEMMDESEAPPRIAYSESINDLTAYYDSQMQNESLYAISDGRWKLILHREKSNDKGVELFDLQADPHELTDLSEKHPEVSAQLRNQLDKMQAILQDPPRPAMDEKTKERLKSLGYIK
ncbi:MAG: sulfatase [Candidatus Aminicenantes bacterium]|nr:MAG: sulfatase [Candidatus Aminicenantes bacterium]